MSTPPGTADQTGGVNITGTVGSVGGDIIGGDKITYNSLSAEELVAAMEARGFLRPAEEAGLQRRTTIMLAQRLKPRERLDFEQALAELERAVEIALDVIATGERGTNEGSFVNVVLSRVAERIRSDDLDGGAKAIDAALAELKAGQVVLLEEGVKVDTLRRDAGSVARRIEMIVAAIEQPTDRPAWLPAFRMRLDGFQADGRAKGVNFSLLVAIELSRRMVATARDADERGVGLILLGLALWTLGERESGPARLEEAVLAYRDALEIFVSASADYYAYVCRKNLVKTQALLFEKEK